MVWVKMKSYKIKRKNVKIVYIRMKKTDVKNKKIKLLMKNVS